MAEQIESKHAPAPIGPYSQAIKAGDFVYISGQIALNPQNNTLVAGDLRAETDQVMKNLGAVLEAAGLKYEHVIKCSIFLKHMDFFPTMNEIYEKYFSKAKPARECVAVAGLPKDVNVEISAIAYAG